MDLVVGWKAFHEFLDTTPVCPLLMALPFHVTFQLAVVGAAVVAKLAGEGLQVDASHMVCVFACFVEDLWAERADLLPFYLLMGNHFVRL